MAGHRNPQTTARYFHPGFKAAKQVHDDRFSGTVSGTKASDVEGLIISPEEYRQTRRDSNPRLLPPEGGSRANVSPEKQDGNATLRLVAETPKSPAKPVETPHDRAQTGHTESFTEAALAYFANPTPELFDVCRAACAAIMAARKVG